MDLEAPAGPAMLGPLPMNFAHFVRIDRDGRGPGRHYVVHTHEPNFTLELAPDLAAPDGVGQGVIKRLCVPNSWAGDYGQYGKMLAVAQDFFAESNPAGSQPVRR